MVIRAPSCSIRSTGKTFLLFADNHEFRRGRSFEPIAELDRDVAWITEKFVTPLSTRPRMAGEIAVLRGTGSTCGGPVFLKLKGARVACLDKIAR